MISTLGERPGAEIAADSSVRLFATLLERNAPLSLDEAAETHGGQKAGSGESLNDFEQQEWWSGFEDHCLNTALWTAMTTQQRRGED